MGKAENAGQRLPQGKQHPKQAHTTQNTPRTTKGENAKKTTNGNKPKKVRLKKEPEYFGERKKPALIFPGLLNEVTKLSLGSPLRDTLETFYIDLAFVPEQRIRQLKQEFHEALPHILKKISKVRQYVQFASPVVPDFTGNDVITGGDLEILFPLKQYPFKEEHLEPGYVSVRVGKVKDLSEEEQGNLDQIRKNVTNDHAHISPIKLCKILHEGLCPPPPRKKKGKLKNRVKKASSSVCSTPVEQDGALGADGPIQDGRTSGFSNGDQYGRVSATSDLGEDMGTPTSDRMVETPIGQVLSERGVELPRDETLSDIKEEGTLSRMSKRTNSRMSKMSFGKHSRRPSDSGCQDQGTLSSENGAGEGDVEGSGEAEKLEESAIPITVDPFVVDEEGAKVIVQYESLRIRLVPAMAVRPGDEISEHDFLLSEPFEHDENPESHILWRQSCVVRERVITRSMSMADGGNRLKALRAMMALSKIDPGLEGLTPYLIKTTLLHNFDNTIDVTPRWQRNSIDNCFVPLLRDLSSAFNTRRLPHFFLKGFNLLDGIPPQVYARIRSRLELLATSDAALIRALKRR